jgi:hypothetical protein
VEAQSGNETRHSAIWLVSARPVHGVQLRRVAVRLKRRGNSPKPRCNASLMGHQLFFNSVFITVDLKIVRDVRVM